MKRPVFWTLCLCVLALFLLPTTAEAGSCSAWQDCSDGSTVDCAGSTSCNVGSNYVQCDNQARKYCPTQSVCSTSKLCPKPPYSEQWYIHCTANFPTDTCYAGYDYVQCGSNRMDCQDCENASNGGGGFMCLAAALRADPEDQAESMGVDVRDQTLESTDSP